MTRMPAPLLIALLAVAALAAIVASLGLGSSGLDALWAGLSSGDPLTRTIVLDPVPIPIIASGFAKGSVTREMPNN